MYQQILPKKTQPFFVDSLRSLLEDLVNKGPSSPSILSFARKNRVISVAGNRDVSSYRVARGLKVFKEHQKAKYGWVEEISKKDVEVRGGIKEEGRCGCGQFAHYVQIFRTLFEVSGYYAQQYYGQGRG